MGGVPVEYTLLRSTRISLPVRSSVLDPSLSVSLCPQTNLPVMGHGRRLLIHLLFPSQCSFLLPPLSSHRILRQTNTLNLSYSIFAQAETHCRGTNLGTVEVQAWYQSRYQPSKYRLRYGSRGSSSRVCWRPGRSWPAESSSALPSAPCSPGHQQPMLVPDTANRSQRMIRRSEGVGCCDGSASRTERGCLLFKYL